jgi:hypothetical protein
MRLNMDVFRTRNGGTNMSATCYRNYFILSVPGLYVDVYAYNNFIWILSVSYSVGIEIRSRELETFASSATNCIAVDPFFSVWPWSSVTTSFVTAFIHLCFNSKIGCKKQSGPTTHLRRRRGEGRYSSYSIPTWALDGVSGQRHTPAAL